MNKNSFHHLGDIDASLNRLDGLMTLAINHVVAPFDEVEPDAVYAALESMQREMREIRHATETMMQACRQELEAAPRRPAQVVKVA